MFITLVKVSAIYSPHYIRGYRLIFVPFFFQFINGTFTKMRQNYATNRNFWHQCCTRILKLLFLLVYLYQSREKFPLNVKISVDQNLKRARAHIKRGDIHAAENLYREILARYPQNQRAKTELLSISATNSSSSSRELSPQIVEEFMTLYGRRDYEKIIARANVVLSEYPKATQIWNIVGAALMGLGKSEEASKMFARLIQIDP